VAALTALSGRPADERYARARSTLYASVPAEQVASILRRVAPTLLDELKPAQPTPAAEPA
jgi:hypothetical protein